MSAFITFIVEFFVLLICCAFTLFVVKAKFWRRVLLISCFTLILSSLASLITETKFFSIYVYPENLALKDFDITDYAVAKMRAEPSFDDRIILINFGNLSRGQIGDLLNLINEFKPKVIGLEALFNCRGGLRDTVNCPQLKDTLGNRNLSEAIRKAGNVVLASELHTTNSYDPHTSTIADSLEASDFLFAEHAVQGFTNFPISDESRVDIKMCRTFFPKANLRGTIELNFAIQIAKKFNSKKVDDLLRRTSIDEIVNFRRNISVLDKNGKYQALDYDELLSKSSADTIRFKNLLRDKIVIVGYLGASYGKGSPNDEVYTPLNPISAGRSLPDMFGIVLHANIISMILDQDYINVLPEEIEIIVAFLSCLIHVVILMLLTSRFPKWFEILSVGLILAQLFIYSWLRINLFILFGLKINLFLTITSLAITTISISLSREIYHLSYKRLPVWLQQKI